MSVKITSTYTVWCDGPRCRMFIRGTRAELNADSQIITLPVPGTDDKED